MKITNALPNRWPNQTVWILGVSLLTACKVGPNYKMPATSAPSAFFNGNQTNLAAQSIDIRWWTEFRDPELESLVSQTLAHNYDLQIATANIKEARALRQYNEFNLLPVVNGVASYEQVRASAAAVPYVPSNFRETELYNIGFDASWELDFFGRVRRTVEANTADVEAAIANRRDVMVTLISEVARNYFELRGAQNQLAVNRRNVENQRETVNITQARFEGGRGTELDVARAKTQMSGTQAIIPPIETAIAQAIHRLSVLTGQQPAALNAELAPAAPIPTLPSLVAIGNPEDLLRRRSDLRVAERHLAAATARIGVATADLFPRVTFNGTLAFQAATIGGLGKPGSDAWSWGPSITWAALDYGHVQARIKAAGAEAEAALATYERTVLTVLEETENALVAFGKERVRQQYLRDSVESSQTAATLARQRFDAGATDFLTVLDAERAMLLATDQLAQSETRTATALVAVYKALGGGWETPTETKTASATTR
jgi:multidrug efflux system outer membrane protein